MAFFVESVAAELIANDSGKQASNNANPSNEQSPSSRGYLGLSYQRMSAELAAAFELEKVEGALIDEVVRDSPAEKGVLQPADILLTFNDRKLINPDDLSRLAGETQPGARVPVDVWRQGKTLAFHVTPAEQSAKLQVEQSKSRASGAVTDVEKATALVTMIKGKLDGDETLGAGILFGRDTKRNYIVTANHVLRRGEREAQQVQIQFKSMPGRWFDARLMPHADPRPTGLDLAVLAVESFEEHLAFCNLPLDRLGRVDDLKRGAAVYPVGYPRGAPWGMPVSADRIAQIIGPLITFESPFVRPGHSGGALLTEAGRVVGLIRSDQDPFGVAVSIDQVLEKLRLWQYPVFLHEQGALHRAAMQGDQENARQLLAHCADVNERRNGWAPLHLAAWYGHAEVANLLLAQGAQVDAQVSNRNYSSETALHIAAEKNFQEVVRVLLERGADFKSRDAAGSTPLESAVDAGAVAAAELLLQQGADPNANVHNGYSYGLLETAVEKGKTSLVELLLKSGAKVRWEEPSDSPTPLHLAAKNGRADIVAALLEHGARVDHAWSKEYRYTPLREALDSAQYKAHKQDRADYVKVVKVLLAHGAKVTRDLLDLAINSGDIHIVEVLLANGVNVNQNGLLCDVIKRGGKEMLEILIKNNVDVNNYAANDHWPYSASPLLCAAYAGDVYAVKALLKSGAKVEQIRPGGDTALHAAVKGIDDSEQPPSQFLEIIKLLYEAGADINARTQDRWSAGINYGGKTPLAAITKWVNGYPEKYHEVVKWLRAHGAIE